jgi:hypothetical protein
MKQKAVRIALCCLSLCTAVAHGMMGPPPKQQSRSQRRQERQKQKKHTIHVQPAPEPDDIASFVHYEQEVLPSLRNLLETSHNSFRILSSLPIPDSYEKRQADKEHTEQIRKLEQHIVTLSNHSTHYAPGRGLHEVGILHDEIHQLSANISNTTKKLSALACDAINNYTFRPTE